MKIFLSRNRSGFTFIELLISIGIIAIFALAGMVTLRNQGGRARDTRRKADLQQMRTALEFYRKSHNNTYPTTGGVWRGECTGYGNLDDSTGANGFISDLAPDFIAQLPRDPRSSVSNVGNIAGCPAAQACYLYRSNGTNYKLLAHCTAEGIINDPTDPFYDPCRPDWAMQVSSSQTVRGVEDNDGDPSDCGGW